MSNRITNLKVKPWKNSSAGYLIAEPRVVADTRDNEDNKLEIKSKEYCK